MNTAVLQIQVGAGAARRPLALHSFTALAFEVVCLAGPGRLRPSRTENPNMKIQYQLRGLSPRVAAERPLDQHLDHLDGLLPISSAHVLLEHQRTAAPPFCASVELAVPGPDIHAAARDHTLEAVVLKVSRRLEEQIEARKNRQELRLKGREQCRRPSGSQK